VLAPHALNDSYSPLPDSNLYFGEYSCGDGRGDSGGSTAFQRIGDAATGFSGSVSATTARVTLVGPSGTVDLPLHNGWYGVVVPYAQPAPTRVVEYDAAGAVTTAFTLPPQYFAKDYLPPNEASAHHTLIAKALPDGRPITVERSDTDRFGAYAFFLTIAGQPVKSAVWEDDGTAAPAKADFWVDDVLAEGDARVLLIQSDDAATVTATLADGGRLPLTFEPVSATRSLALVVIPASQAAQRLMVGGTTPAGVSLGNDTVDLPSAAVVGLHERN
jgi:hypothetical protein